MDEINKKSHGEELIDKIESSSKIEKTELLDLEELQKPSKGEKLIRKIKEGDLYRKTHEKDNIPVEITDGKAIEKNKGKRKNDKYGIPVDKRRKNWDSV